jgi:hypothetical protein
MKKFAAFLLCISLTSAFIKAVDNDDINVIQTSESFDTTSNQAAADSDRIEILPISALYEKFEKLSQRAIEQGDDKALLKILKLAAKNFSLAQTAYECSQNLPTACTELKNKIELISHINVEKRRKKFFERLEKEKNQTQAEAQN